MHLMYAQPEVSYMNNTLITGITDRDGFSLAERLLLKGYGIGSPTNTCQKGETGE